jgi:hypothetical protein
MDEKTGDISDAIDLPAANDAGAIASRHRGNPIPGSFQTIKGYPPTLKLFEVWGSPFYYVGLYRSGKKLKRSTKTTKLADAMKAAKKFYDEILLKEAQNLPLTNSAGFQRVALSVFEEDKLLAQRGELSEKTVTERRRIYDHDLLPFFSKDSVKDITYARLHQYQQHLATRGNKPVSGATVKIHFSHISKILTHALKLGLLDRTPSFPTVTIEDKPRSWFSETQFVAFKKKMLEEINSKTEVRYYSITEDLLYLTNFMAQIPLRPADLKQLKHKNIEIIEPAGEKPYLRVTTADSKTTLSSVISTSLNVRIYKEWKKKQDKRGLGKPDDYVFFATFADRKHALEIMGRQFYHVLEKADLKKSQIGGNRTLYSLRHTAICKALLEGVDEGAVATNARVGIGTMKRFYSSHLTAEANRDKLLARRKVKKGMRLLQEDGTLLDLVTLDMDPDDPLLIPEEL